MAFVSKDLSVLAYANGFTLWHYATSDQAVALEAGGYFNGAADMLRVGDMILANAGGTPSAAVLVVAGNAAGTVDAANLTPVAGE